MSLDRLGFLYTKNRLFVMQISSNNGLHSTGMFLTHVFCKKWWQILMFHGEMVKINRNPMICFPALGIQCHIPLVSIDATHRNSISSSSEFLEILSLNLQTYGFEIKAQFRLNSINFMKKTSNSNENVNFKLWNI